MAEWLAVDWNKFNTGSNPVPIETFVKYGRIDLLRGMGGGRGEGGGLTAMRSNLHRDFCN